MIGKREILLDEIATIKTDLESARERAHSLVAFENDNSAFQRRIQRYQGMLDSLDSQLEKADLPSINSGLNVRVLRPAGSGALVGPLMGRDLAMGGFFGFLIGALLGFMVDWSERTFRSPDELDASLGVSILTHLPLVTMRKPRKKKGYLREIDCNADPSIRVLHEPHSPFVEALRGVRNQLFTGLNRKSDFQIVQVTSVVPGDGKSTVTANLAASIASAHRRVLIIDADLRRPVQQNLFAIVTEIGLTDVLNGECAVEDAIVETEVPGLFVLPTGALPSNPSEALALPEFGYLLDDLRSQFDIIFLDTPPMLAVSDASTVAGLADGVLFVLRIGRKVKPAAMRAIHILRTLNVNIIGVVVNAIGESSHSINYANAWSETYGGQPGGEYTYGYYEYGADKYLNASKGHSVTVKGSGRRPLARTRLTEVIESCDTVTNS
jgi:polysaccharide biosynthesis transport protein